jgi:hypothetical protein
MQRRWTIKELINGIKTARSIRQVIIKLGLIPAGGNYQQVKQAIFDNNIDIDHFSGRGWSKNMQRKYAPVRSLSDILKNETSFQSYKLKLRLFREKILIPECSICGWNKMATDGRIPVELDHMNGNRYDNRIENLRILCPNCHSLQLTHRGKNKKRNKSQ